MCFKDTLDTLRAEGIEITATQLRWAINSGKISRPPLDGSLTFVFGPQHVAELLDYFRNRKVRRRPCEMVA
jgi:hypothetical protein